MAFPFLNSYAFSVFPSAQIVAIFSKWLFYSDSWNLFSSKSYFAVVRESPQQPDTILGPVVRAMTIFVTYESTNALCLSPVSHNLWLLKQMLCCVTWCSNCRRRWSWDSSCLLCSSRMCMRASSRPLCCRRSLASANRSASSTWLKESSDSHWPPVEAPCLPCCSLSWSYSPCKVLGNKDV